MRTLFTSHACVHAPGPPISYHRLWNTDDDPSQAVESLESGRFQTVHLAAGCFWGLELAMQRTRGVVASAVGYTQGEKESPSYSEVCSGLLYGLAVCFWRECAPAPTYTNPRCIAGTTGHTEACEVIYDPNELKFEELLEVFWNRHNPTHFNRQGADVGTQYRGGIYYTSEAQRAAAEASKATYVTSLCNVRSCVVCGSHVCMCLSVPSHCAGDIDRSIDCLLIDVHAQAGGLRQVRGPHRHGNQAGRDVLARRGTSPHMDGSFKIGL